MSCYDHTLRVYDCPKCYPPKPLADDFYPSGMGPAPRCDGCDALRAEVERLRAALSFYGMHTDGAWGDAKCAKWVRAPRTDSGIDIDNSQPCTCGFDAALDKEPT